MVNFETVLGDLVRIGFYDVVLVWLLFFGVILGLLQRSKVLGGDKQIDTIVSAAIAFFIVLYNPGVVSKVVFYSTLFGSSAMVLSALLVIVLFLGILGIYSDQKLEGIASDRYVKLAIFIILVLIGYAIFTGALGGGMGSIRVSDDVITMAFLLIFVGFVVWVVSKGGSAQRGSAPSQTNNG